MRSKQNKNKKIVFRNQSKTKKNRISRSKQNKNFSKKNRILNNEEIINGEIPKKVMVKISIK